MNKLVTLVLAVLMISGCSSEPQYIIKGSITGADSVKFLLQKRVEGKIIVIDSSIAVKGEFKMKGGRVDHPEYVSLVAENLRRGVSFFLENSEISIKGHIDSLNLARVTGSKTQDEFNTLTKEGESFNQKFSELSIQYGEASKAGDIQKVTEIRDQYKALQEEVMKLEKDFIKNHPASYASPVILQGLSYSMEASEIESFINVLDTNVAKVPVIMDLMDRVNRMKAVEIGKTAPDFTLNDVDDNPVSLSSRIGKSKILLVDFWASWCSPCRQENPNVVKVWKEFNKKGFDVFGVSLDRPGEKESWLKAISDDKLTWTHVSDLQFWNCEAAKLYAVSSIPANFLLDEKGTIIAKNLREEDLYNKVKEILSVK